MILLHRTYFAQIIVMFIFILFVASLIFIICRKKHNKASFFNVLLKIIIYILVCLLVTGGIAIMQVTKASMDIRKMRHAIKQADTIKIDYGWASNTMDSRLKVEVVSRDELDKVSLLFSDAKYALWAKLFPPQYADAATVEVMNNNIPASSFILYPNDTILIKGNIYSIKSPIEESIYESICCYKQQNEK